MRNPQTHRPALVAIAVATLALLAALSQAVASAHLPPRTTTAVLDRPNILVVMTDDQTYESIATMPEVQALGQQGASFTDYHANFPLCCPSRATLLTGQYVHEHGVWTQGGPETGYDLLEPGIGNTLPVWLQAAGYTTIMVGKFLNGYEAALDGVPPGWDRWRVPARTRDTHHYWRTDLVHEDGSVADYAGYKTHIYGDLAIDLIAESDPAVPFFLWLSFNAPHTGSPSDPDDPNRSLFPTASPFPADRDAFGGTQVPAAGRPVFNERSTADKPPHIRRLPRLDRPTRAAADEAYGQQLETLQSVDRYLGHLRDALAGAGRLDDTVIVFTTDNGYFYGEHRIPNGKVLPYPQATRLPLVISGPGFDSGVVRTEPRSNVDLTATILELAGATPGRAQSGIPLTTVTRASRPLLLEGQATSSSPVQYGVSRYTGVRKSHWFYARYQNRDGSTSVELYDRRADPDLLSNLAGGHPLVEARLRGVMERMAGYTIPTALGQ